MPNYLLISRAKRHRSFRIFSKLYNSILRKSKRTNFYLALKFPPTLEKFSKILRFVSNLFPAKVCLKVRRKTVYIRAIKRIEDKQKVVEDTIPLLAFPLLFARNRVSSPSPPARRPTIPFFNSTNCSFIPYRWKWYMEFSDNFQLRRR